MRELLPLLPKPSRYLGCEEGAIVKSPEAVAGRMALAFPDMYEVGMSYTGMTLLHHAVNREPDLWAERVFTPCREAAAVLRSRGAALATLESDTPLAALDMVGLHLTHELCFTNVLYMLDLAGIPRRAADRDDACPLVLGGGGCAFNAEPVAPFVDAMVLGDGEVILPDLLRRVAAMRRRNTARAAMLDELATTPGLYVPSRHHPGATTPPRTKVILRDLDEFPYPRRPVQPFGAVHDRLTLEIARGCTRGCRFCHAGMTYRPVRERSLATLDSVMQEALAASGYGELSFLSLSTGDYSALAALFRQAIPRCAAEQVGVSLPSLRVGSVTPEIMAAIAGIRRTGATLAPEAGSQRLRDVINKGVTAEGLLAHVRTLFEQGWSSVKLYFMIGLPTETEADLVAIHDLCQRVRRTALATPGVNKGRVQVTGGVSTFVPKPHTPFQWARQISLEETRAKLSFLKEKFHKAKGLTLRYHLPEMSWLEGVFSRGDRTLADVVERAYDAGALFDSWNDQLDLTPWREAFANMNVDPEAYLAARDEDAALPWDHLNPGVHKPFLLREWRRALHPGAQDTDGVESTTARRTPDCRFGKCVSCGVCDIATGGSTLAEDSPVGHVLNYAARDQQELHAVDAPRETRDAEGTADIPSETDSVDTAIHETDATPDPARADVLDHRNNAAAGVASSACTHLSERAAHVRLWFAKMDLAAYLSTLELQAILERAFRRAALPLAFSQGYHPLPLLSFGKALPVGVASEGEYVNCFLREALDPATVTARLAPVMPSFLPLLSVESLSMKRKQPQPVAEDYRLALTAAAAPADAEALCAAWKDFRAASAWPMVYESKRGVKSVDIRPYFEAIEIPDTLSVETDSPPVRLTLDWSRGYMSPLRLVQGVRELSLERFLLTKEATRF